MAGGVPWQIKSNAAMLQDNGVAGWGIAHATYDITDVNHQVDGYIDHFTIPAVGAANHHSLSVFVRMTNDAAGTGATGYSASWDRFGDGTNTVTLASWIATSTTSNPTVLGTAATGVKTPVSGDKFSLKATGTAPVTLTAFINDVQVTTTTENTLKYTGTFGGIHSLRSTTSSDMAFSKWAAFKVTPPITPPPSSRDVTQWPGSATSVFNVPRGADATGTNAGLGGSNTYCNVKNGFGESVYNAPPDANIQQDQSNQFSEEHTSVVNQTAAYPGNATNSITPAGGAISIYPMGKGAIEFYQYKPRNSNAEWVDIDLRGSMIQTNTYPHWGGNSFRRMHVAGTTGVAGVIRTFDITYAQTHGYFPHFLEIEMPGSRMSYNGGSAVWPGNGQDGDAATSYTGAHPMGSTFFIDEGVAMPGGLATIWQYVFKTMQLFGLILVDRNDNVSGFSFRAEANVPQTTIAPLQGGAPNSIMSIIQRMTNQYNGTSGTVNGPGTRLAPLPPAV